MRFECISFRRRDSELELGGHSLQVDTSGHWELDSDLVAGRITINCNTNNNRKTEFPVNVLW